MSKVVYSSEDYKLDKSVNSWSFLFKGMVDNSFVVKNSILIASLLTCCGSIIL